MHPRSASHSWPASIPLKHRGILIAWLVIRIIDPDQISATSPQAIDARPNLTSINAGAGATR